jgi:hypothetical protein
VNGPRKELFLPSTTLSRRALRWVTAGLVAAAVVAACGNAPSRASGATAPAITGPAVVMIIRHAEKPTGGDVGLDQERQEDPGSLTATGWERARRLVGLFAPAHGLPAPGLRRPDALYAAGATDDGEGLRTRQTLGPLSAALGVPVDTEFGKGDEAKLAKEVLAHPGTVLVSWQHSGIPDIVGRFPAVTPAPPKDWPSDRYDVVWTLTRTATGWQFAQVPERVLPGDGTEPIAH